jgi:hypothetical protein
VKDIRSILRLTFGQGLSTRAVSERLKISKTSISTYLLRAREAGLAAWPLPADLDEDNVLEQRLFRRMGRPPRDTDYVRMPRLFEDLALARLDGRFLRLIDKLARVHLLVLDDWGTHTLTDRQRLDVLEIFEERYRRKSTLITAQLPVAAWHEMIGEATLADAILDRIVHNAHRLTLEGDSMRKRKTPTLLTGAEINEINHP